MDELKLRLWQTKEVLGLATMRHPDCTYIYLGFNGRRVSYVRNATMMSNFKLHYGLYAFKVS